MPAPSSFVTQLGSELVRLLARKRTYIGFGAFLAMEVALICFFQLDGPKRWIGRMDGFPCAGFQIVGPSC